MKNLVFVSFIVLAFISITSCSDNKAAEVKLKSTSSSKKEKVKSTAPVKEDGAAVGVIETEAYAMKLHRAFAYEPSGSEILAGMKPKEGNKFIYLDVSLRNKSTEKLNGGFLFIALRVTDKNGAEYKKPATGLAAYTSEHPEESNTDEYNALWEDFEKNEFHRDIIYCVEVPKATNDFVLHMPTDRKRNEWKTLNFSVK